jgi:hypothetical protein
MPGSVGFFTNNPTSLLCALCLIVVRRALSEDEEATSRVTGPSTLPLRSRRSVDCGPLDSEEAPEFATVSKAMF